MERITNRPRPSMVPRVIVASDDPDRRASLASALASMDLAVHEAHDGWELATLIDTVVMFGSVEPIAIVTERVLPGYDAFDLIGTLRKVTQATPVVVLDDRCDSVSRARAKALGAELVSEHTPPDEVVTALLAAVRSPRAAVA